MTFVAAASIGVARADLAPADPVPDAPEDIAPSVGCSAAPARSGTYTFRHGKVTRTYAVSLPKAYDGRQPMRLVVAFHSWGGDEREFVGEPGVVAASSERNYILVAARGLGAGPPDHQKSSWTFRGSATGVIDDGDKRLPICDLALTPDNRYPSCRNGTAVNHCSWTQCQDDDVAFVVALVSRLDKTLCVDTHHTYAAGGFTGGMFIWSLGADERSARLFRAVASIVGLPLRGDLRPPAQNRRLPALLITGNADREVPAGAWDDASFTTSTDTTYPRPGRLLYTGATAIMRRWAEAADCPTAGPERPFDAGYPQADCRSYCGGDASRWPMVLDCRSPMGHEYGWVWSWKLVLDFFDRH
jgi:polyhydroxybutyrate depolymerase